MVETEQFDEHAAMQLLSRAEALEEELMAARAVQRFLLPPELQTEGRYTLRHLYQPLHHVGGDFVDTAIRADGTVALLIADVSGHGVAAALSTALIKTSFMRHAGDAGGPAELLADIHRDLEGLMRFGRFITAEAIILHGDHGVLASAGHPLPLLLRGGKVTDLDLPTGMPLLAGDGPLPEESRIELLPGDHLMLYTDGLVEAQRIDGDRTDVSVVIKALECLLGQPGTDMPRDLYEGLLFGDMNFTDDVAIVDVAVS